ncbi:MAG: hypothetical protein ACXAB7_02460 [Candidatus Kariarchaeaceae archaeon]
MLTRDSSDKVNFETILNYLRTLEDHHSYLIREKIYPGSDGLVNATHDLETVVDEYAKIEPDVLGFHKQSLQKFQKDIEESIDLILGYSQFNLQFDELIKYSFYIQSKVKDLLKFIINLQDQTDQDIEKIELDTKEDEFERLKFKFEDNIDQILKSFSWKEYEAKILGTQDDNKFNEFTNILKKFNSSKLLGSQIPNKDYLDVLVRFTSGIRDIVAENFEAVFTLIPLVEALSKIFDQDQDIQLEIDRPNIPVEYVKQTINHFIGISRIPWLSSFFGTILEDTPVDKEEILHKIFADRLYHTTKDPREYFLWTMSYYSRIQNDEELIQLSYKVANLTGTLLTIVDRLEKLKQNTIATTIIGLDKISYEDAVSDLSEIYEMQKNWIVLMKQGLTSKLDQLKQLLVQIIQFDEIAEDVLLMMQTLIPANHKLFPVTFDRLQIVIENY